MQPALSKRTAARLRFRLSLVLFSLAGALPSLAQTSAPIRSQWFEEAASYQITIVNGREAVANEVLIKFRELGPAHIEEIEASRVIRSYRTVGRGEVLRMRSSGMSVQDMIAELGKHPDVEYVEPNYLIRADQFLTEQVPNDPSFQQQWTRRPRNS